MGLTFNAIKFLFWSKNLGVTFSRTATLGHLGFSCSPRLFRRAVADFGLTATREEIDSCFQRPALQALYADNFLKFLGAKKVETVDYSDFEGATLLHDLNSPFPEALRETFDVVLDGGTLEHIFDFPSALRNTLELIAVGGHFITIAVPANSMMGHGFYQFSPELFFRVFNEENGFAARKMVLYRSDVDDASFYQVKDPAMAGKRVELGSSGEVVIAVLAQRTAALPILSRPPQQSDYEALWNASKQQSGRPVAVGRWRTKLSPYWPHWMRSWKNNLIYRLKRGPNSLRNKSVYHKLSQDEICRERAGAPVPAPRLETSSR